MLIRGQDKDIILFTKDIDCLAIGDNGYVSHRIPCEYHKPTSWCIKTDKWYLGWYSSEEKAVKVLDMIQESYCTQQKVFQAKLMEALKKYNDAELLKIMSPDTCVFQMPKDEDVQLGGK